MLKTEGGQGKGLSEGKGVWLGPVGQGSSCALPSLHYLLGMLLLALLLQLLWVERWQNDLVLLLGLWLVLRNLLQICTLCFAWSASMRSGSVTAFPTAANPRMRSRGAQPGQL